MKQKDIILSFGYKFIERIASKGIGLIISITLARLIDPNTFGLLAIIAVFINLAQTFAQGGFGTALVQNKTTEDSDYSTVFFLSLGIAIILDVALYVCAPLIAQIYRNESLIWPLRVMALMLPIGSLNSVQNAKLQREMKFKRSMKCNLVSTIISGTVGIIAAYCGADLWALVIYNLSSTITVTICILIADGWYPRFVFSIDRVKTYWSFGWKMLVSGLLCSLYNDVRALIIGKKYSTTELAYYDRGQQFPDVIANTLDTSVQTVMLPIMSAEQDSIMQLNNVLMKALSVSMFIVAPVMLGLAAVADTLIPLLLTEKWAASIPLMEIFCVSYLTLPIMTTNLSLIKAMGRSDIYMRTEVVRRVAMLVVLLVTVFCFDSVMAIAIGYALSAVLDSWIIVCTVKKLTGLGWSKQMRCIWKSVFSGGIMAILLGLLDLFYLPSVWKLCVQVTLGIAVYCASVLLLQPDPVKDLLTQVKKWGNK